MSTFTLQGLLSTTGTGSGTGARAPFVEGLIENLYVEIGGVAVQNVTNYGQLFNIFRQFQLGDRQSYRSVLQNELQPKLVVAEGVATPTYDFTGYQTNDPVACWNWLGLLGTKVLDTTILPPVRIYLRLAPTAALAKKGNPAGLGYSLTDVNFTVDLLDIADNVYSAMIAQRLRSAPIEIGFDNYTSVTGSRAGAASSTRFSTSAHCVQAVMASFLPSNWQSGTFVDDIGLSSYFRRFSGICDRSHFRINSVPYPSIPCDKEKGEIFADTTHSMNLSQDSLGQTLGHINSLLDWHSDAFVHYHSFCYNSDGDDRRLSGLDGRGNVLIGSWEVEANAGASDVTPWIVINHKSILRVGAGKLVECVL
jgi:hypothetical protein